METRVMQDWKQMRWLPFIETRTLGVFLTTNPTVHYDMMPLITEWRFRRLQQADQVGFTLLDDTSLRARMLDLGNQIHNLGCERQNDEELSDRLAELRNTAWDLAMAAPTEGEA